MIEGSKPLNFQLSTMTPQSQYDHNLRKFSQNVIDFKLCGSQQWTKKNSYLKNSRVRELLTGVNY